MAEAQQGNQAAGAGLEFAAGEEALRGALAWRDAVEAVCDARGWTVRAVPTRRTVALEAAPSTVLFLKHRRRRRSEARGEWRALHELLRLGFCVPRPVAFAELGRRTVLAMRAWPGRPLDVLLREAAGADGSLPRAVQGWLVHSVAPMVRQLHQQGLVFRDLYWNHVFAPAVLGEPIGFVDVERVFRPRWRKRRWIVKDIAGLLASWPDRLTLPRALALRFLRAVLWCSPARDELRALVRAILRKAAAVRAHVPRYG